MAFSKVTLNGETLMDVTDDTVAANNMLYGTRGTAANGTTVTGAVVTTPVDSTLDTTSHNAIENAAVASALALKADSSSIPSATSDLTNDSNFVADANYVHTDNNFTTTLKNKLDGIAEGATVDDHKWGGVTLGNTGASIAANYYIPYKTSAINTSGTADWATATTTPTRFAIAKYDDDAYLKSTTPTAGDNTTKVATTAFVSTAISNLTPSGIGAVPTYTANATGAGTITNSSGKIIISESEDSAGGAKIELEGPALTLSATKDLDNTSIILKTNNVNNIVLSEGTTTITGVVTPTNNTDAANKAYVDSAVSSLTPVVAYTATLAAANWSNTTPSTYTYSNTSLTCGASGDVPPLITCTSNETEYSTIASASATPGTGITFTAPSAPAGAIGLVIIDYK